MEFKKDKSEHGYTIRLEKENSTLVIMFGGNGDLYWNVINKDDYESQKQYFTITKENYEIFSLFDKLYRRIENCDVYRVDPLEEELCLDDEERERLYERTKEMNEELSEEEAYEHLCTDTAIVWHSDGAPYGEGNRLSIYKSRDGEKFLLEFIKYDKNLDYHSVEISNSGSRYSPFNTVFMDHFNSLCEIDPDYHQIHIEEILYQKRLTKQRAESSK